MNTEATTQCSSSIPRGKLLAVVRKMIDGEPMQDPDPHPVPRGPWDTLIRDAVQNIFDPREVEIEFKPPFTPKGDPAPSHGSVRESARDFRLSWFARIKPAIWDIIGGGPARYRLSELNPQPLPPRRAFLTALAEQVIRRAEMMHDFGGGAAGEERGIIIVSGYVQRFTDDLCPDKFRPRWPFPWPPPWWFTPALSGLDLVILAAEFQQAATETYSDALRRVYDAASEKFADAGVARV